MCRFSTTESTENLEIIADEIAFSHHPTDRHGAESVDFVGSFFLLFFLVYRKKEGKNQRRSVCNYNENVQMASGLQVGRHTADSRSIVWRAPMWHTEEIDETTKKRVLIKLIFRT